METTSSVASNSRASLLSLLTMSGETYHLPHLLLPREFRSKRVSARTKVAVGKHSGFVCKELGRGAYGVVVLMDVGEEKYQDTIALKAQSPTDCLAWEYEILRRVEERVAPKDRAYGFPRALSFMSLADGGLLSMTAASKTGLNLIDLANVYRVKLGETVPEIIALHYTSRMLKHLEILHWHGKILVRPHLSPNLVLFLGINSLTFNFWSLQHCDIKPDNFVLCTLQCSENAFHDVEYSDLMIVDFGRAVYLDGFSGEHDDVRKVLLHGNASRKDMRCVAMRCDKPWSFDIDTYGLLCTAHVLLYGTHLEVKKDRTGLWRPVTNLKRYWQKDLWDEIFKSLLNGAAIGSRARSLRTLREQIDSYLRIEANELRSLLTRQVNLLPTGREKLV